MDLVQIKLFLARAVPWPSASMPGFIGIHSPFKPPGSVKPVFPGRAFDGSDAFDRAVNYTQGKARTMKDDLYVCMSLQSTAKRSQSGKRVMLDRAKEHAIWLRSFYLELDLFDPIKRPNNYKTSLEAAQAFNAWRIQLGMPEPTLVLWSGSGGFHFHWVLPEAIPITIWQPLANALKNACEAGGLLADPVVTDNPACLMRIPGTHNFKHNPPAAVRLMESRAEVPLSVIEAVLGKYKGTAAAYAPRVTGSSTIGKPSAAFAGVALPGRLDEGIETWRPTIEQVAEVCPFIANDLASGGVGREEPQWREALAIAYYVQDGPNVAHELSWNFPTYSADETDEKYLQIEATHSGGKLGPHSCAVIGGKGIPECVTCPNRGSSSSPVNLVKLVTTAVAAVTVASTTAVAVSPSGIAPTGQTEWLPSGYFHDPFRRVYFNDPDPKNDGNFIKKYLHPLPIHTFRAFDNRNGGNNVVSFSAELTPTVIRQVEIDWTQSVDLRDLARKLASQGVTTKSAETQAMKEFLVSFTQQLKDARSRVLFDTSPYGWTKDETNTYDGFVFNRTKFNCKGDVPIQPLDAEIDTHYRPRGDMAAWKRASGVVLAQNRMELIAPLCVAMGGPGTVFTGMHGAVLHMFGDSGTGKSNSLKVCNSVWADPHVMNQLNDTVVSIDGLLASLRNLPVIYDEMSKTKDRRLLDLIMRVGQGRSKARGKRDGSRAQTFTWSTVMISASNPNLNSYIDEHDFATVAGRNRVMEYEVGMPKNLVGRLETGSEAERMIGTLQDNCGLVGLEISKLLGKNAVWAQDFVSKASDKIDKSVQGTPDDRFHILLITLALFGGVIGNKLGVLDIDLDRLLGFMVEQLQEQRGARRTASGNLRSRDNIERHLRDFVHAHFDNLLVTREIWTGNSRPPSGWAAGPVTIGSKTNAIHIRAGVNQKMLRISVPAFGAWLKKERGISRGEILPQIKVLVPGARTELQADLGHGVQGFDRNRVEIIEIVNPSFFDFD